MMDQPHIPAAVMGMAQQANVVIYPVLVRAVGCFSCPAVELAREHAIRNLAAATGGTGFFDVMDLPFALRAAEEDSHSSYVLGFYPTSAMLDGKYHKIVVKLANGKLDKSAEIHYRTGYLATKIDAPTPAPSLQQLLNAPLQFSGIGLTAQASEDSEHAGLYDLHVTVDLHDIHLDHKEGRSTGTFDISVPNPSVPGTVKSATAVVDLTDEQLPQALESGFPVQITGVESKSGEIRVVVRDRATEAAGSLRIPVNAH